MKGVMYRFATVAAMEKMAGMAHRVNITTAKINRDTTARMLITAVYVSATNVYPL